MKQSPTTLRRAVRALVIFALILPVLPAQPAGAIDVFSRSADEDLLLRDVRRLKGLQVTVEVRFLTVADEFLERVGVDFSGTVNGAVTRNGGPVPNAKVIVEAFKVKLEGNNPPQEVMTRTGRQTVVTDAAGRYQIPLKSLVPSESRKEILMGEVASLVVEATGKNGKRVSGVHLGVHTALGGLIP